MSKEGSNKGNPKEDFLSCPDMPFNETGMTLNVDNPVGIPESFQGENFDVLAKIYKAINSSERIFLKIKYGKNEDSKETATVFFKDEMLYFTEEEREITNFKLWLEGADTNKLKIN